MPITSPTSGMMPNDDMPQRRLMRPMAKATIAKSRLAVPPPPAAGRGGTAGGAIGLPGPMGAAVYTCVPTGAWRKPERADRYEETLVTRTNGVTKNEITPHHPAAAVMAVVSQKYFRVHSSHSCPSTVL